MKQVAAALVLGSAVLLSSCSPAPTTAPPATNEYTSLAAVLGDCERSQSTVAKALSGSDTKVAIQSLADAQGACESAASSLRKSPLPSLDPVEGPAAIEQMASALGQISRAMQIMDKSPTEARNLAQAGMKSYKAGLDRMERAKAPAQ